MFRTRKGQSVAEYAVLLSLVIAAAVGMQIYVKRGIQARVKTGTDAFTSVTKTIDAGDAETANFGTLSQYEPYYQESSYQRYQENIEQEHMGAGKVVKEKVSDVTAAAAGGFDIQVTTAEKGARDARWEE